MKLHADHVAGGFLVAIGVLVIALSGDLPIGRTSMPGAGFMPILIAALLIIFGGALFLRSRESQTFSEIDWSDGGHAVKVLGTAVVAVALYATLGFIVTMILMMLVLLIAVERLNIPRSGLYSVGTVLLTYFIFAHVLQAPLPRGILGYY